MSDTLNDTFEIEVDGEKYIFKKPTIKFRFEVGARSAAIRTQGSPEGMMNERLGLTDNLAYNFSRSCAIIELYLVRSTATWVYGIEKIEDVDLAKPPELDWRKWPPDREETIDLISGRFDTEVTRFRTRGTSDKRPPAV